MGKYGNGIYLSDENGNGIGTGIKSLKREGIGTKNLFPHTSSLVWRCELAFFSRDGLTSANLDNADIVETTGDAQNSQHER